MAEYDFAIVGTSPLAGLLAGTLARDHGRRVVLVGRPLSPQRLPRRLNLALPLSTRPETWRMLRRAESQTHALLGSIGIPEAARTCEMQVRADLPDTEAAVDHVAHLALGYGHQVRRVEKGWAFRRVGTLDREIIERRLPDWLAATGAVRIDNGRVDAEITVLADDEAILDGLLPADRPALLVSQPMTTTLIKARPAAPVSRFADRGVTLVARSGNTVLATVVGDQDLEARLASALQGPFPVRRIATTRYRRLASRDGAPVFDRSEGRVMIAGLADTAPFFATALARFLAGTSDEEETRWFAAHASDADRTAIADFVSSAEAVG